MFSGVDVLLVPGKSSPFVDRTALHAFRRHNICLHVVYYEDHTFARRGSNLDCGFSSKSIQNSLSDIRHALYLSGARLCIAYSLGGLLMTCLLRQANSVRVDGLVLLHPFLSMTVRGVPRGLLDTPVGVLALTAMSTVLPVVRGQRVIPRQRSRFDWLDYMVYKYPLVGHNPLKGDLSRHRVRCTLSFALVVAYAMMELKKEGPRIETPVLLVGGTQDDVCDASANLRVCRRLFAQVEVRTLSSTHNIMPSADPKEDVALIRTMACFLSVVSRDIVVP